MATIKEIAWAGLLGTRVVNADFVRRLADMDRIEKERLEDCRRIRARVALRLRNHRRRAQQKRQLEGLVMAGHAFAGDLLAWNRWRSHLHAALEAAVSDVGMALPRQWLLEKQLRHAMAQAADATTPLKIHVNEHTRASVERLLADLPWGGKQAVAYSVVVTDYLADDSCVVETPRGLFEGRVDLEVAAFCQGVRASLREQNACDDGDSEVRL